MNVVPSLTVCGTQGGVYSSRERQTQKEGAQEQGLGWLCWGTGRGFGHSGLRPNRAEGPVFTASGKGTVGGAPGFLLPSGDVREVIEVFPGVSDSRERSGGFLVCWWFVLCPPGLSCSTTALGQLGQPGHPTGTAASLPQPEALLPKHLAALGMPSADTTPASL